MPDSKRSQAKPGGIVLSIEASGDNLLCAITGPAVSYSLVVEQKRALERILAPCVSSLLEMASIGIRDISAIVIGSGPGSFTGLRIAHSFAKGLRAGSTLQVYTLPLSHIMAAKTANECALPVLSLLDARKSRFYGAWYSNGIPLSAIADAPLAWFISQAPAESLQGWACACADESTKLVFSEALNSARNEAPSLPAVKESLPYPSIVRVACSRDALCMAQTPGLDANHLQQHPYLQALQNALHELGVGEGPKYIRDADARLPLKEAFINIATSSGTQERP